MVEGRGPGRVLGIVASGLALALVSGCATSATPAAVDAAEVTPALELTRALDLDADLELDDLCVAAFRDVEPVAGLRVGLLTTSGSIDDGTFNQFAYEGMQAAGRCFGLETTFVASGTEGDELDQLRGLVSQGVDAIVSVGFALGEDTATVASEAPDVAFIGLDQVVDDAPANLAMVTFRDDQAGYLAGTLAGALTRSGTVAVVAGPEVPPVVALADGFEAGVAAIAPEVTVLRAHLSSFSDPLDGGREARAMLSAGADVVYGPAGLTGAGAILEAAAQGRWVIGVDQDQYLTTFEGGRGPGADHLVSSTVKRVDLGVFLPLADLARGAFQGGSVQLDAASGGVTYAPLRAAAIPAEAVDELERVRVALADGSIEPLGP